MNARIVIVAAGLTPWCLMVACGASVSDGDTDLAIRDVALDEVSPPSDATGEAMERDAPGVDDGDDDGGSVWGDLPLPNDPGGDEAAADPGDDSATGDPGAEEGADPGEDAGADPGQENGCFPVDPGGFDDPGDDPGGDPGQADPGGLEDVSDPDPGTDLGMDPGQDQGMEDVGGMDLPSEDAGIDDPGIDADDIPEAKDLPAPDDGLVEDGETLELDVWEVAQDVQDDAGHPPTCPEDMALVPLPGGGFVCMDRWEASRADATADSFGSSSVATSRPGVLPWYVGQMSIAVRDTFFAACEAAGKRPCARDEWFEACNGPNDTTYFFGNVWNRETCNCVDTFCDDYCAANGISPCNLNENCGYQYYCFHVVPTGTFPDCTNDYGLFDVNGNVWEIVPSDSARGYEVRGGAFNCGGPSTRLKCTFDAAWDDLYAGFRCCKDPE